MSDELERTLGDLVQLLRLQLMQPPPPQCPPPQVNSGCGCNGCESIQLQHSIAKFNEQMSAAAASQQLNYLVQQQAAWAHVLPGQRVPVAGP